MRPSTSDDGATAIPKLDNVDKGREKRGHETSGRAATAASSTLTIETHARHASSDVATCRERCVYI